MQGWFLAALCRGLGPLAFKIGLGWWPNTFVAVLICYAMLSSVAIAVELWRTRGTRRIVARKGVLACVGLCNGFAVMCWMQSLALGPVSLTSLVVASYPVLIDQRYRGDRYGEQSGSKTRYRIEGVFIGSVEYLERVQVFYSGVVTARCRDHNLEALGYVSAGTLTAISLSKVCIFDRWLFAA